MRNIAIACGLAVFAAFVQAQQPGLPPAAPAAPAIDPVLDDHLAKWQFTLGKATNFSAKFELTRTEAVFKKERKYSGAVLCMKPNLARLSIGSTTDKNDFEAYICNGKSLYEYNWAAKTITEIPLAAGQGDNLMLDMLGGMTAEGAKKRFQITQFNPKDPNYVYLDIKPTLPKDKQEFEHMRFALYGPNVPAPFKPYMPAQMYMLKPNGDAEMWKFSDQVVDAQGVSAKVFEFVPPDPKEKWNIRKATPPPTGPATPAGGLVRPNK
jgi:TIGR03009 family protein